MREVLLCQEVLFGNKKYGQKLICNPTYSVVVTATVFTTLTYTTYIL